jgi:hypothetical protein
VELLVLGARVGFLRFFYVSSVVKTCARAIFQDITERQAQTKQIEYLNQLLTAIRNVNQLIVTERSREGMG